MFTLPFLLERWNKVLHDALNFGGGKGIIGGAKNLLRHGVLNEVGLQESFVSIF